MVEMRGLGTGIFALTAAAVLLGCSPGEPAVDSPSHERTFTKHLRGLNEDVTFAVKTNARGASSKYVLRADGRQQSAGQVRAEELAAHLERFGHLTAELSDRYLNVGTDTKLPVAVWFELDIDRAEIRDGLRRGSAIARGLLAESIGVGGEGVVSRLNAWGIASHQYPVAPAIFANVTHAQAIELSRISGVRRIAYGGAGQQVTEELALIPSPGNSITALSVDTEFNDQGFRGAGQGIGLVEQANCRLLIEHEIFDTLVGQFVEEPGGDFGCTSQGQCNHCASFSVCANTECYDDHLSRIASVVLQDTDAGDYGAPEAAVYHPTVGDQDYFARMYDLVITKAAGNNNCVNSAMEACPHTLNSICVGSTTSEMQMSCNSADDNPGTDTAHWEPAPEWDREEPDVVSLGGQRQACGADSVCVADSADVTGWIGAAGTSFSAPAVATAIVLFR